MIGVSMGDCPMPSGTWKNYKTGHTVVVRDCIISDDRMIIISMDGRHYSIEEFSNYTQLSESTEKYEEPETQPFIQYEGTPIEIPKTVTPAIQANAYKQKELSAIESVVNKLKNSEKPSITINVTWEHKPEAFKFLTEYLAYTNEEILDVVLKECVNSTEIIELIRNTLRNKFMEFYTPEKVK